MKTTSHPRDHRRSRLPAALIALALILFAGPALAGAPVEVPVQGLLTETDGTPVDGERQVTFRIYPDAATTGAVWESTTTISVDRGLFDVQLGQTTELDSDIFHANPDAQLTITIAGDEESPRIQLGAVPSAAHALTATTADDAQTLQGMTPDQLGGASTATELGFDDTQAQLGASDTQSALEALLARVEALEQTNQDLSSRVTALEAVDVQSLETRVAANEADVTALDSRVTGVESDLSANTSSLTSLQSSVSSNATSISTNASNIGSLQSTLSGHGSRLSALETKTASMSAQTIGGHSAVVFDSVNLHVRNGTGSTSGTVNGTGNLIIGYDEAHSTSSDKSGSHNLVLGRQNNYTSYGGLVGGYRNAITAEGASVLTGTNNTASSANAAVVAGNQNVASGSTAAVVGGYTNTASGFRSVVVSGWTNIASGSYSAVLSGDSSEASAVESAIGSGSSLVNSTSTSFLATGTLQ